MIQPKIERQRKDNQAQEILFCLSCLQIYNVTSFELFYLAKPLTCIKSYKFLIFFFFLFRLAYYNPSQLCGYNCSCSCFLGRMCLVFSVASHISVLLLDLTFNAILWRQKYLLIVDISFFRILTICCNCKYCTYSFFFRLTSI